MYRTGVEAWGRVGSLTTISGSPNGREQEHRRGVVWPIFRLQTIIVIIISNTTTDNIIITIIVHGRNATNNGSCERGHGLIDLAVNIMTMVNTTCVISADIIIIVIYIIIIITSIFTWHDIANRHV